MWKILDTGMASAEVNMRLDSELLSKLSSSSDPLLHLYSWNGDAATYGHFINPKEYFNLEEVEKRGLNFSKRPTGGGIIFHMTDLAFSALLPASHPHFSLNTLENYTLINRYVVQTVKDYLGKDCQPYLLPCESCSKNKVNHRFCMASPTIYDVMVDGRKIGGAAQRRTRNGFLHQGTISIAPMPEEYLEAVLLKKPNLIEAFSENSAYLIEGKATALQLYKARKEVRQRLIENFLCESEF